MKDSEDVSRLIRLKRYENPGEEYFARFAADFKDRQRAELLHRSSFSLLGERVHLWLRQFESRNWIAPAGAAAAVIAIGLGVISLGLGGGRSTSDSAAPAIAETSEANAGELPPFPESPAESIEITLPKAGPPRAANQDSRRFDSPLLPAGSHGALVEL